MTAQPASFPFLPADPSVGTASLVPLMPLALSLNNSTVSVMGMFDTGAAVSVLPFSVGRQLGAGWDGRVSVQLTGNLATVEARVLVLEAVVASNPAQLAFAWAKTDAVPVLLGQVNFFLEFDVCFFRSAGRFEVKPKGP